MKNPRATAKFDSENTYTDSTKASDEPNKLKHDNSINYTTKARLPNTLEKFYA